MPLLPFSCKDSFSFSLHTHQRAQGWRLRHFQEAPAHRLFHLSLGRPLSSPFSLRVPSLPRWVSIFPAPGRGCISAARPPASDPSLVPVGFSRPGAPLLTIRVTGVPFSASPCSSVSVSLPVLPRPLLGGSSLALAGDPVT